MAIFDQHSNQKKPWCSSIELYLIYRFDRRDHVQTRIARATVQCTYRIDRSILTVILMRGCGQSVLRQKFKEFTYFVRFPDEAPAIGVPPAHGTKGKGDILGACKLLEKGCELARVGKLDGFRNFGIEFFKENSCWKHSSGYHRLSFQQS